MSTVRIYWLGIPYSVLIIFAGIKNFVLSYLPLPADEKKREHLESLQRIKWYKWYLGRIKNIAALALLSLLGSRWLSDQVPLINHTIFGFLAGLVLLNGIVILLLWLLCAGVEVPFWLEGLAMSAAYPRGRLSVALSALGWGGGFILGGAAALSAWAHRGDWRLLIPGFVLFTLGFVSLLGAFHNKTRASQEE